jgi:uncharacterized protein
VPHGEAVTPEKLAMIERAENLLRDLGFRDLRVRHHESAGKGAPLARIEVGLEEMPRLLGNGAGANVAEGLKKIGYAYVTLDLQGYRRGSLNAASSPARK